MATRNTIADGDIMATGENCVWNYDVEPGDLGIPSNGDLATIAHTCTMSTGTLSLAALDLEGVPEVSYAQLSISGGSLTALDVGFSAVESGGLHLSGGSVTLTSSTTLVGPDFATTITQWIIQTEGTLTINANCQGGASGASGDPPDAHGSGGALVYKTGGTLVINGNCVAGTGADGTMNDEYYFDIGGSVVEMTGSSGTVEINGNCSLASGQDELSGHVVTGSGQPVTVNGDATGGTLQTALLLGTSVNNHVYGKLLGRNAGKFVLTGQLSTDEGDAWAYYACGDVTLDLTNLDLANAGTFCVIAAGGTVTTTGAEVTNAGEAQFSAIGCTIPTVNWPAGGGLTQQQVQDACAAALTAYDPPTKAELDTAADGLAQKSDWTTARASLLDNLGVGGPVASQASLNALNFNTRCNLVVPGQIVRPTDGSTSVPIEILLYDAEGNMEAPDSTPTVTVVNGAGTSMSDHLGSVSLIAAGHYRVIYTAQSTDAAEQLRWFANITEGGVTRTHVNTSWLVDAVAVDFTADDRTKLQSVANKLPSTAYLAGSDNADGSIDCAQAGDAMTLTEGERAAVSSAVASAVDDGLDRTGFALSATGLDEIPATQPTGPASTFRGMIAQTWARLFCKTVMAKTAAGAGTIKTYAADGTTTVTTQTFTETSTTQTQGRAT